MGFNPPIKGNVIRVDLGSDCVSLTGDPPFASGKINGSPVAAKPSDPLVTEIAINRSTTRGSLHAQRFSKITVEVGADQAIVDEACDHMAPGGRLFDRRVNHANAKPSHRAVTLTAETLALARTVADDMASAPEYRSTVANERARRLLVAVSHAEGMPADDLRKLCKWAREVVRAGIFELNTGSIGDARSAQREPLVEVVEIIDRILMHLAIDEMPVGSFEVRGSTVEPVDTRIVSCESRLELRGSTVEVSGGTHLRALGFAVDTASLRRLAHGQGSLREDLVMPVLDEVDRLRAELRLAKPVELRTNLVRKLGLPDGTSISEVADAVDRALVESATARAALIRIDRFVRGLDETEVYAFDAPSADGIITRIAQRRARSGDLRIAHQLGVLLDLPSNSTGPAFVAAVECLVERADGQGHTLKLIADEFAGPVDTTNPLPEVRALVRRHDRCVAQLGELADEFPGRPAANVDILAAVRGMKRDLMEISRAFAEVGDQIGNPPNVWVALRELIRKNRLLDVTLGPLFGISKHGQSLNAEELIDGAKAKMAEVESLDRLGDWLRENMGEHFAVEGIADTAIRRLREGGKLLVAVRADLRHREDELEALEADDWRECKAQALPLTTALRRIDAILKGRDPAEVSETATIMSAAAADDLVDRVAALGQLARVPSKAVAKASTAMRPTSIDRLASGFELGPFRVSNTPQDDLGGDTMLVVHETGSIFDLPKRVFAITITRDGRWSKWTIDSARDLAQSLSDALRKIDRISHGVDPAEAMAPVITAAMADELVVRIAEQFDGFRQLAERTMTATASLAALEALIHRGFDRLREVDPEFVESLRKGGS
jgi:hypothetical protein